MSNLKPMEFGDIFNYTFRVLRHRFLFIYPAMGWIYLPVAFFLNYYNFALSGEVMFYGPEEAHLGFDAFIRSLVMMLLIMVLQMVLKPLTDAGAIKIVSQTMEGKESLLSEVFHAVFEGGNWLKLLAAGAVVAVITSMGALFLLLPALLFMVMFSMVAQVVMVERGGVWKALSRSWSLAWSNLGRVLLVLLVMYLLVYVFTSIVNLPISLFLTALPYLQVEPGLWTIGLSLAAGFLDLIAAPVPVIAVTIMYFDLRARREGLDLEQRLEALTLKEGSGYA